MLILRRLELTKFELMLNFTDLRFNVNLNQILSQFQKVSNKDNNFKIYSWKNTFKV